MGFFVSCQTLIIAKLRPRSKEGGSLFNEEILIVRSSKLVMVTAFGAALLFVATPAPARRHRLPPDPTIVVTQPNQRVAIEQIQLAPVGSLIEVVGYFSHKAPETDGDLHLYLINHKGGFVVVEAPRRFRDMKYFIRSLHLHRGELVVARGTLTRQPDKPTKVYPAGWMELNPVADIGRYSGPLPDDLHYVRVVHRLFGRTHTEYK